MSAALQVDVGEGEKNKGADGSRGMPERLISLICRPRQTVLEESRRQDAASTAWASV